jgi:YesN/AraC family two-component response regulator
MSAEARPHILVVDDEPSVQEAMGVALGRTYVVHPAATGDVACAVLRTRPIAGIILDAILGPEHGLDLVERFRTLSHAPILLLTGYGSEELAIRAIRAGVRDYLKKPPNVPELHAALARLVPGDGVPADPLAQVRLYLDTHLEKEIDLADLARQMGWSERHLCWRFSEVHGKTPRRYHLEARLRSAADLLLKTDHSVEQISRSIGFSSPRRFWRAFKGLFGLTPSRYRSKQGRGENHEKVDQDSPET